MRFPLSALFLLTSFVASFAWADRPSRDLLRVSPENGGTIQSVEITQSAQVQVDRRPVPQFEWPEAGYGNPDVEEAATSSNGRKGGRLSAEERRALRKQINDAGLDLYVPKR